MQNVNPVARATRRIVAANLGVALSAADGGILIVPRMPTGETPPELTFLMPKIPSGLLERSCGLLRAIWHQRQCVMGILLYLELEERSWIGLVPPQSVTATDVRMHCDHHGEGPRRPNLRLAGSIQSVPPTESG